MAGRGTGACPGTGHVYERWNGAATAALPASYRPRRPEQTPLHVAVRSALPDFLRESSSRGGLPSFVVRELEEYFGCGVLANGFSRVHCTGCGDELLVAFSCKRRGVSPSCCARRASDVAAHLVDHVLPRAPYRQWTSSLPIRLRWTLARDAALCSEVLSLFIRTLFNALRARGRSLALPAREAGAVSFIQRFGSALQLNVHFHVLVPEGVFADDGTFHPLPPPEDADVESLLETFLRRLVPLLERHGLHELESLPEHALDALQLSSAQWKLSLGSPHPPRRARRCATLEGFSLHANTRVHENDRTGLETLCRYGARGPLSLERLSLREDGKLLGEGAHRLLAVGRPPPATLLSLPLRAQVRLHRLFRLGVEATLAEEIHHDSLWLLLVVDAHIHLYAARGGHMKAPRDP